MAEDGLNYRGIAYSRQVGKERPFRLEARFQPQGDQEQAFQALTANLRSGARHQVLLGVTGSGKTYSMARVIEAMGRPALVLAHNKTLAAQLYQEFRHFFPDNAVEYFVSYYDYYQPEAYIPATDTYIEKEVQINEEIDRLRHSATRSLFERRDCVIVASVSCIYGLGSPEAYYGMVLFLEKGKTIHRRELLLKLVELQYTRNDVAPAMGNFRARGDVIDIYPPYGEGLIRVELFGDEIEALAMVDPLTGRTLSQHDRLPVYPKSHYVIPRAQWDRAVASIRNELQGCEARPLRRGEAAGAPAPPRAHHVRSGDDQRAGVLPRHRELPRRPLPDASKPANRSPTLLDYLSTDLIFVDECTSIPQVRACTTGTGPAADPGGARVPPAVGAGQPPAWTSRNSRAASIGGVRVGQRQALRRAYRQAGGGSRSCAPPARRPGHPRPAGRKGQIDDLYAEVRRRRRRRLCRTLGDHADEEDGRGSHRLPA